MTFATSGLHAVAVTGANGFIGSRMVKLLASEGVVRDIRNLTRRRFKQNNALCVRLDDERQLREALLGCQAVVHCAFDFHDLKINLEIARNLARICAETNTRLVHLSSWVVYGTPPDGELDENAKADVGGDDYKDVKIAIERSLLRSTREAGLDLVILQPTIVYGPFSSAWTDTPVRQLMTGIVVLPNGGQGLCNAVYVDDVCQAAISALKGNPPKQKRFLISGPHPVQWCDFFGAYQAILGLQSLRLAPPEPRTNCTNREGLSTERPHSFPTSLRSELIRIGKGLLGQHFDVQSRTRINMVLARLRQHINGQVVHMPTGSTLALYTAKCRVSSALARSEIGYVPRFDLAEGMAATAPYLRQTYACR